MSDKSYTILVVEDDPAVRNLVSTALKSRGYQHLTAATGNAAIASAATSDPDIVLLDLGLPDMDGVDVIRRIRTWSTMPIIVLSARAEDADKIEALDAGAEDVGFEDGNCEIVTLPENLEDVRKGLMEQGFEPSEVEVTRIPKNTVAVEDVEQARQVVKLYDALDEYDDVQNAYSNFEISDEILEQP